MTTLTEIILKGVFSQINLDFLSGLLVGSKETRFNDPEISSSGSFDDIVKIFYSQDNVDFVISTNNFNVNGRIIQDVFINLGRHNDDVELLFYFNLKDIGDMSYKESIDYLKVWVETFSIKYNFYYFICQMDNAGEKEYYFNESGLGPLYEEISS